MKWLRHELTMLHRHKLKKGTLTKPTKNGIAHGEYCITWDDIEKILSALETLK